jgi:hypothetical protein
MRLIRLLWNWRAARNRERIFRRLGADPNPLVGVLRSRREMLRREGY